MSELLEIELKVILEACQEPQIPVFVIGAFSVRAYDCLLRTSGDIDLAVSSKHWPALKQVLTKQSYSVTRQAAWIRASKITDQGRIEVHVALDGITDFNSASIFLVTHHQPQLRQPSAF